VQRRVGMVDLDTGELLQSGVPIWVGVKVKSPYEEGWVAMNQHFLEEFAARQDIGRQTYRVFLYLDARLNFRNLIHVSQADIATALKLPKQNVNRAIRKLEELGILIRGPKIGKSCSWRLNPNAGWKGKVKELRPAIEQHAQTIKTKTEQVD
jgi:Winged helix-turn-helix DNA-binding